MNATQIYPIHIFMKLNHSSSNEYNGIDTIEIYKKFCNDNRAVWFSTNALSTGISDKRRAEFINAITNGKIVEIYFAIGKGSGGTNKIAYKAKIVDIITDPKGISSPEKYLTPKQWCEDKNKILLKLKDLESFDSLTTDDFIIANTGKSLTETINKSRYSFGYIKRK